MKKIIFLLLSYAVISSCNKQPGCTDTLAVNYNPLAEKDDGSCQYYKIGQSLEGGVIFYLDETRIHGLIVAPFDQSSGAVWGNWATSATGNVIGSGRTNTGAIVAAGGPGNYAAYICDTLTLNGYNDWFLPSWYELAELLKQRNAGVVSGFYSEYYWSSTEYASPYAWAIGFGNTVQSYGTEKTKAYRVRAIRAF